MNKKSGTIIIAVLGIVSLLYTLGSLKGPKIYTEALNTIESSLMRTDANNAVNANRQTIITETVKKASPCVVGINVTEIREYRDPGFGPFFDDPFFRQFFGGGQTYKQPVKELGSGFIISSDGYIITNDHVAGNASEVVVTLTNGKHYNAKIIGTDRVSDVCLLKIEGEDLPFLPLGNSESVMIGEWTIAFGNPFGLFDVNDRPTVTVGVLSAQNMNLNQVNGRYYVNMLQTDAAINGGNSGGPLLNAVGEVIGMNTLIFTAGGNQGNIGLGFAIPINKVKKIIDELKEHGKIDRDFQTGLNVQNIDDAISKYFKLETTRGVIVTKVKKGSPADKAGMKAGDVILQLENIRIDNEQMIVGAFQEYRTGQTVQLKLLRENEEITVSMKLEK